ncbi:M61 family metallopeptidase [Flavihumibacter stibioxidans]|uniref:Metalloprotease with PDZ domain n=1 Tax=Flavihumibacter stibioxidans TaxID=1834163 RepID=A0ABR7MB29_9BACT|nr:M61 family metallopeptidase [Flavihumibacter stibioxidans]MBC6492225.1 hypothetical protein [Flavihumibacter stibioxidans]
MFVKQQILLPLLLLFSSCLLAQSVNNHFRFRVSVSEPERKLYEVELTCNNLTPGYNDFSMPVWMPGYYQVLPYADQVEGFRVSAGTDTVRWEKADHNTWRVYNGNEQMLKIIYRVKAGRNFVATNFIDGDHAFIAPTGSFLHLAGRLNQPVEVAVAPYPGWKTVATGLDKLPGDGHRFTAPDFDVLYDSPILMGNLVEFPSFSVKGVPHYFLAHQPGELDQAALMADLRKIVSVSVDMMKDIPFKSYSFLGIGPGMGGIEHLNSAAVSFSGRGLDNRAGRLRMLSFLAHEYFHHYNAKRIRPVELGPFDYDHGSRTNMLWVAEGVTAYYDELLVRRAGLMTEEELIESFRANIAAFEAKPGRLFQSVTQASYDTWSDGPFGRTGDAFNKTVSYYEKGPILAIMLDFAIRHHSSNRYSLDDVMRRLYNDIYKRQGRGYTETEFRATCEKFAGTSLEEFFGYVYTVKQPDYKKYFSYAGLDIDTAAEKIAGAWVGLETNFRNDTLFVSSVDFNSPAWAAGLAPGTAILSINGLPAGKDALQEMSGQYLPGDIIKFGVLKSSKPLSVPMIASTRFRRNYQIRKFSTPTPLQRKIFMTWSGLTGIN